MRLQYIDICFKNPLKNAVHLKLINHNIGPNLFNSLYKRETAQ